MKKNVEMIKTIVLWVLFLSSIALLLIRYNLIGYGSTKENHIKLDYEIDKNFEYFVVPTHITIKYNQYDITQIIKDKDLFYQEIQDTLTNSLEKKVLIKKIKKEEFAISKKEPNITVLYNNIPAEYIQYKLNLKKTPISDIGYIQEICFILDKDEIYFKTKDMFYKLKSNHKNKLELVDNLSDKNYERYYPKFENVNPNTNIVLPLSFNLKMQDMSTQNIFEEVKIADIAKNIFKERFDFTSSLIQKNGVYFYSYNNGQEILRITSDGFLEYKNENFENIQSDLESATETMLLFLKDLEFFNKDIFIESVNKIEKDSKTIYDFSVKNIKDFIEVSMQNQVTDAHIQVLGDTVVSANIYLRYPKEYIGDSKKVLEPSKALNLQIESIKEVLKLEDVQKVIANIKDINLIYSMNNKFELEPAWKFKISNYIFIINATTGEMMKYGMV